MDGNGSSTVPDVRIGGSRDEATAKNNTKPAPQGWTCDDPYQFPVAPDVEDPWKTCHELVSNFDRDMCDAWTDEIEKLLIFAGLFSAAVTAFVVDSYKNLQEAPDAQDIMVQLLTRITAQLDIINGYNTTAVVASWPLTFTNNIPTGSVVRINIFWFLSLVLSLATVLIGTLCLQWLREYQRDPSLWQHKDSIGLRHIRFSGLRSWRIPTIMATLPLLLQAALVLFLAGIVDLLWHTSPTVAKPVIVVIGLTLLLLVTTTISPALQCILTQSLEFRIPQCPYKSPQSFAFMQLAVGLSYLALKLIHSPMCWTPGKWKKVQSFVQILQSSSWLDYDMHWKRQRILHLRGYEHELQNWPCVINVPELRRLNGPVDWDSVMGLSWLSHKLQQNVSALETIYQCFRTLSPLEEVVFMERTHDYLNNSSVFSDDSPGESRSLYIKELPRDLKTNPIHKEIHSFYVLSLLGQRNQNFYHTHCSHMWELWTRFNNTSSAAYVSASRLDPDLRMTSTSFVSEHLTDMILEIRDADPRVIQQVSSCCKFLLTWTDSDKSHPSGIFNVRNITTMLVTSWIFLGSNIQVESEAFHASLREVLKNPQLNDRNQLIRRYIKYTIAFDSVYFRSDTISFLRLIGDLDDVITAVGYPLGMPSGYCEEDWERIADWARTHPLSKFDKDKEKS
ncbi:hypothetical protein BDQ12DRAFT_242723 [Crucibulum laeve]|uniref:DUF6535 domain-containing protein n=1 Tax=Crucibulum laeve TaxID=68775 RepID=A0A5C3LX84_9AGAR|nr:hypothetical protein BDQ12DRAFT_242723 [Crucibulum laeve]